MKTSTRGRTFAAMAIAAALAITTACSGGSTPSGSGSASGAKADDYGLAIAGTITAGVPQGDAPFVSPDKNGKPFGMLVDLNNTIAERMGLKIVYKVTTTSAGLPLVTSGQYDMMIADLTMSEERKNSVDFTTPFYIDANDVIVRTDSTATQISDLDGLRVGVGVGSAQDDFAQKFLPKTKLVEVQTNAAGLDQLLGKNLDGFVMSSVPGAVAIAAHQGKLKVGVSSPNDIPEAMAVRKGMDKFLADYNKQLATAVDDGTFLTLYKKYFPGVDYPETMYKFWPSLETQIKNGS